MEDAIRENDPALNTHSDAFDGALNHGGGYRQVYTKTGTMLFNLEYVLGRHLFMEAMQFYFGTWQFAHPYFEDFRQAITEYTKVDLNWFFDQWLETSKNIDYKIKKIKAIEIEDHAEGEEEEDKDIEDTLSHKEHRYQVTFERKGRMHMPIDFEVFTKDENACERYLFHIPNTEYIKSDNAFVLPKWFGWDKINPTYTAEITVPAEIDDIVIDPSFRLADINMLNNSKKLPIYVTFDSKIKNPLEWTLYRLYARPTMWYNVYDGLKIGAHFNGNFMRVKHNFKGNLWYGSGLVQDVWHDAKVDNDSIKFSEGNFNEPISFELNYDNGIDKLSKNSRIYTGIKSNEGLRSAYFKIDKKDKKDENVVYLKFKTMIRPDSTSLNYLLYPDLWSVGKLNNTIGIGYKHSYKYSCGSATISIDLKSSTLLSDFDYHTVSMTHKSNEKLGKFDVSTRIFGQYFTGSSAPNESALYFAGANPEEMSDNPFYSSAGIFPKKLGGYGTSTNNLHYGGGLNMRGYSGYLIANVNKDNNLKRVYKGSTGASINAEIAFDRLFYDDEIKYENGGWDKFKKKPVSFDTYIFGDAGVINYNDIDEKLAFADLRFDAGIGAAITVNRIGTLEDINPFTLRFDLPLFLNRPPATDEFVNFRWIFGINKAF